jgi:hypothetical protein
MRSISIAASRAAASSALIALSVLPGSINAWSRSLRSATVFLAHACAAIEALFDKPSGDFANHYMTDADYSGDTICWRLRVVFKQDGNPLAIFLCNNAHSLSQKIFSALHANSLAKG